MNSSQDFPSLRLEPFEELQYWESQPGFRNQVIAILDFRGQCDRTLFRRALGIVLARHPLTFGQLHVRKEQPRSFTWNAATAPLAKNSDLTGLPTLSDDWLDQILHFETTPTSLFVIDRQVAQRCDVDPLQINRGPLLKLTVREHTDGIRWILQTHHVICDGLGGMQMVRELLQVYDWLFKQTSATQPAPEFPLRELESAKLRYRGRSGQGKRWRAWLEMPMKAIGLLGATKFLCRRPVQLTTTLPRLTSTQPSGMDEKQEKTPSNNRLVGTGETHQLDQVEHPGDRQIQWIDGSISREVTRRLTEHARGNNVTLNSLLVALWLKTLETYQKQQGNHREEDWYRVIVPTNERTLSDLSLPACNRVSLVYVDRRSRDMEYLESLVGGINFEMGVIRRWGLSSVFLSIIRLLRWVPGVLRWYGQESQGWATSYITNLGAILEGLRLERDEDGRWIVGQLRLESSHLLPPLRRYLPAVLAIHRYRQQLRFSLHFEHSDWGRPRAETIMKLFVNRIKTL